MPRQRNDAERCGPCERGETAEVGGASVHLCDHATIEWMHAGWCPCCGRLPHAPVRMNRRKRRRRKRGWFKLTAAERRELGERLWRQFHPRKSA